eukprot:SAG31_NODE_274_length_18666_cov_72.753972_4_plen_230_part_00
MLREKSNGSSASSNGSPGDGHGTSARPPPLTLQRVPNDEQAWVAAEASLTAAALEVGRRAIASSARWPESSEGTEEQRSLNAVDDAAELAIAEAAAALTVARQQLQTSSQTADSALSFAVDAAAKWTSNPTNCEQNAPSPAADVSVVVNACVHDVENMVEFNAALDQQGDQEIEGADVPLVVPGGWQLARSRSTGRVYYFDPVSGRSAYDPPPGTVLYAPPCLLSHHAV